MRSVIKMRFILGLAVAVALLGLSGPVRAQQSFTLADFSGDWYWFLIGGYDEYVETAEAKFTLNPDGSMAAGGQGTFNNYPSAYIAASLTITPEGYVGGTLQCDQVNWHIVRAAMDRHKTEVTGTAWGYKSAVIFRMVRVSGEPARLPSDQPQ